MYDFFNYVLCSQEEEEIVEEEVTAPPEEEVVDPETLIKHPLQNRWALWYFKNDKTKDWASNLKCITAFDTVEDFWA